MSETSQPRANVSAGDEPSGPRAGFGQRLLAFLIDIVLLWAVQGAIWAVTNETIAAAVGLLIQLVYFTYFEGSASGQTVGKRALGIRVVDFGGGGPIGPGRAFIRWICRILSSIPCLLGYLWMLWDREKQTWHDKLATTVVVPTSSYPVDKWPG